MSYTVGLGDSPQRIARRLTGDPRRYQELLIANPHKSIVYVGGAPTFASLGVGEQIGVPDGWLGAAPSAYEQSLNAVGLHPDNPDEMYKQLLLYIANPKAFKDRDPNWPGARDNLSWWEGPKGTANLNWPFHGGKWYDNAPKNDAQYRAVFKVPAGVTTKAWLSKMWGFPMTLAYRTRWEPVNSGFDLIKTAGSIIDAAGNFLRSIPGVKEAIKLEIDLEFAALHALINVFVPTPGSDILHGLTNVADDESKRVVDGLGPKQPNEIVDIILKELHFLGDANVLVRYLVHRMLSTNRYDADFFESLLTFPTDPSDPEKLAEKAKLSWTSDLDPTLQRVIPPLSRLIGTLAATGKIMRSDLLALVGDSDATRKMLDLFGVHDSAPVAPSPKPPPKTAPVTAAPKKVIAFHTPPPAAPPAAPAAPKKVIAFHTPTPAAATATVPAPQMPPATPTPPPLPTPGPPRGAYEPYPSHGSLSAPLDAPPHGHHGGGHPHGGGGGHPHAGRGGGGRRGWWGGDWYGPWLYEPVTTTTTCTTWGDPVEMSPAMESVGQVQLRNSGGRPAAVRGADGVLYLFANEGGALTMRPCAAVSSMLGDAPLPGSSLQSWAPAIFYLYRKSGGGWVPVGDWMSNADAQDQMTTILTASPTSQLGAYVWNGQTMTWKFF